MFFQVMHDKCGQPIERLELAPLRQSFGGTNQCHVPAGLSANRLQQINVLPVQFRFGSRSGEYNEGYQHVTVHQRQD